MLTKTLFQSVTSLPFTGWIHRKFPILQVSVSLMIIRSAGVHSVPEYSSITFSLSVIFPTPQILSPGTLWCPPQTLWRVNGTPTSKQKFHTVSGQASRAHSSSASLGSIEMKPKVKQWLDKTVTGNIWSQGTWAWFKALGTSGTGQSWKQMKGTGKFDLTIRKSTWL